MRALSLLSLGGGRRAEGRDCVGEGTGRFGSCALMRRRRELLGRALVRLALLAFEEGHSRGRSQMLIEEGLGPRPTATLERGAL